ncbi:MAG TPA: preprotein translocase subunit YajC [Jatrophihabitantaceae bacterium]|nr:preprotein translocase subunit YajC [Jatrophihabitantaceae bacterium]
MKSALPLILLAVLLLAMLLFTRRNRERAAAKQTQLRERITFGTDVMTTSGLYGTVVGMNDDDTVQLSIAPGVEVKWAIAALRDVESIPNQYREPLKPEGERADDPPDDSPSR